MFSLLLLPLAILSLVLNTDGTSADDAGDNEGDGGRTDGNTDADQSHANAGGQQGGEAGAVTFTPEQQAYLDRLIGTARKEGRTAAEADAKRKADEAAAEAAGEWEKLATDRLAEIDRLNAEIARRDQDALRARVAAKHKLPADLAARLVGDDEEALEADAKTLAKLVAVRPSADTEAGAGQAGSAGTGTKATTKSGEKTPQFTFDGRPLVAFPNRQ
jgi:hypothetical protein